MVLVSYSGREINAKLVYYGPGLSGKTTNLEGVYAAIPDSHRGKMVSMKTKTERTLFFDFLPIQLGELSGFKTRFLLYTVPGQVYYNATRKLVLKGVDAVVFVADSKRGKMDENLESLQNLDENLKEHGLSLDTIPWVIQYNKRDLPDVYSVDELERALNPRKVPSFEASAKSGDGVIESFKTVSRMLLKHLSQQIGVKIVSQSEEAGRAREPVPAAAPEAQSARVTYAPTAPAPKAAAPEPVASFPQVAATPAYSEQESRGGLAAGTPGGSTTVIPGAVLESGSARTVPPAAADPGPSGPAPAMAGLPATPAGNSHGSASGAEEPAPLAVERVGMRLRRWFARPREVEEHPVSVELHTERREAPPEDPRPAEQSEPPPEKEIYPPAASETQPAAAATELRVQGSAERSEPCREVPILIELEPEDMERGVLLKLKISLRRSSDSTFEDRSEPPLARAA